MILNKIALCPANEFATICKFFKGEDGFPPNLVELTEEQFRTSGFFKLIPEYINSETFRIQGSIYEARLFMYNQKNGFAIINDVSLKRIRFYSFGCKHEMKSINSDWESRKGYHKYVCTKCGFIEQVDSSG